jgi:hypothetical protein
VISVFENFISSKKQNILSDFLASSAFPYRFHNIHNGEPYPSKQLTHHLFMAGEEKQSPHYPVISPLLEAIQEIHGDILLYRAKVNVTMPEGYNDIKPLRYKPQTIHTDLKLENGGLVPHLVCLYYVDDSDGPTYFYDDDLNLIKEISPQKGLAVIFDGDILHAGSNPIMHPFRFAININFLPSSMYTE